jgi:hypothetical protein
MYLFYLIYGSEYNIIKFQICVFSIPLFLCISTNWLFQVEG